MFKSLKNLLGLSLLAFFGVWMGCSSDSSPVSPSNKAVTDDGTATQVSTFSTEVSIPDDSLRVAVTQGLWALVAEGKLDIPVGTNPLTTANLAKLEKLSARGKGITNLEGLQHATNLKSLYLNSNSITNVAPLANLNKLEILYLEQNQITDVSSLVTLNKLTSFRIGANKRVVDGVVQRMGSDGLKAAVAGMPNLTDLKANALGLTDISFLEDLPKLGYLNLNGNRDITSLKPLTCLDKLYDLRVQRVNAVLTSSGLSHHIQYLIDEGVEIDLGLTDDVLLTLQR